MTHREEYQAGYSHPEAAPANDAPAAAWYGYDDVCHKRPNRFTDAAPHAQYAMHTLESAGPAFSFSCWRH